MLPAAEPEVERVHELGGSPSRPRLLAQLHGAPIIDPPGDGVDGFDTSGHRGGGCTPIVLTALFDGRTVGSTPTLVV